MLRRNLALNQKASSLVQNVLRSATSVDHGAVSSCAPAPCWLQVAWVLYDDSVTSDSQRRFLPLLLSHRHVSGTSQGDMPLWFLKQVRHHFTPC
jgi:hypothetical protein